MIYLAGALKNPNIPNIAAQLRAAGYDVFDDWFSAGPGADDAWRDHERAKGHKFKQALESPAAKHVFAFDSAWIERADIMVLALPAGKSGHMELGIMLGRGKPGFILLDNDPERYDVMYQFATGVAENMTDLLTQIRREHMRRKQ